MKSKLVFALLAMMAAPLIAAEFRSRNFSIITNDTNNLVSVNFSNQFFEGVGTIQSREGRRWVPIQNFWMTQRVGQVTLELPTNNYSQLRLRTLSLAVGTVFQNLARAYGTIETIAGRGEVSPGVNGWLPEYEGAPATDINLSNPRFAVADDAGNIYVLERDGHAVVQITPAGRAHTMIGTHNQGDIPDDFPRVANTTPLNTPNGLFLARNHLFVLDGGNHRIRYVDLNDPARLLNTLFVDLNGIGTNSSGLWVGFNAEGQPNEAYYAVGNTLRHWDKGVVNTNYATGFREIGNITVDSRDRLYVMDPLDHRVYRVRSSGRKEVEAGTGFSRGNSIGGDADKVALPGARSVAYLPTGGYFVALDEGARVWYVDEDDNAAPFIFGKPGTTFGDGKWFRAGGRKPKIGSIIHISVAPSGDILLVQGDGRVRRIEFLRLRP